jgi:hypothetical protein
MKSGVYTFRVNGFICHKAGSLLPNDNEPPHFGQIYFYGPEDQLKYRLNIFKFLSTNLLNEIRVMLYQSNPYVKIYDQASDYAKINPDTNFQLRIFTDLNSHKRYRPPTVEEVAAIVVGPDNDKIKTNRDILLYRKNEDINSPYKLQRISDNHSAYDSLHYVLMHPFGQNGWSYGLYPKFKRKKEKKLSEFNNTNQLQIKNNSKNNYNGMLDYSNDISDIYLNYSNNLQNDHYDYDLISEINRERSKDYNFEDYDTDISNSTQFSDEENDHDVQASSYSSKYVTCAEYYSSQLMRFDESTHHYFGRLYQQYIVDQYLKIENARLNYIKNHQVKLRVELYKGLVDAFNKADTNLEETGKLLILPSSFNGGPRYMLNLFQDSMAIVKEFGKPDLFITITCNPNWPEIKSHLGANQKVQDIPDIVSRVFKLKLKHMMKMLLQQHVLGKVKAHMYVIEFQKRGLPHAHILLILEDRDKPKTIKDIDEIVSAEIPDDVNSPLYQTVTKSMNHGICGFAYHDAQCMINGKCSKKYPKQFTEETKTHNDGYPLYRRRNDGKTFVDGRGNVCDNRHIIPYNPTLCTIFDCHINVEICNSIRAVKYIYKYIYKGISLNQFLIFPKFFVYS